VIAGKAVIAAIENKAYTCPFFFPADLFGLWTFEKVVWKFCVLIDTVRLDFEDKQITTSKTLVAY